MKGGVKLKELVELKMRGYDLFANENDINYLHRGNDQPDRISTGNLLAVIKKHKSLAIKLLTGSVQSPNKYDKRVAIFVDEIKQKENTNTICYVGWTDGVTTNTSTDLNDIGEILKDESILKIFYDAAAAVYFLEANGYQTKKYADILVMDQLITNDGSGDNDFGILIKKYLPLNIFKQTGISDCSQDEMRDCYLKCVAQKAEAISALYGILADKIEDGYLDEVLQREIKALPALIKLKKDGFLFNYSGWESELQKKEEESIDLEKQIVADLNVPTMDIQSLADIKAALHANGINVISTSEEYLAAYADDYPVIKKISRYKKNHKQSQTFGEKLKAAIRKDGRIRSNWKLNGSNTGRMACTGPNLQGMPAKAKPYFLSKPGFKLIIADYSQIELRVMASLSKDKLMMQNFMNNDDLHKKTAAMILGKPKEAVSDDERKIAKIANFGLIYGMSAASLSRKIKAKYGINMSFKEASMFRDQYFKAYSGVLAFQDKMLKSDEIVTAGGRRWKNLEAGSIKKYNYPIQGTAAEGLKEALAILLSRINEDWLLVNVIHDEIVLEVPSAEAAKAEKILKESMIEGMRRLIKDVPVIVDVRTSEHW